MQEKLWDSHQSIAQLLSKGSVQALEEASVDYRAVNEEPISLGRLDLTVNKIIMGL